MTYVIIGGGIAGLYTAYKLCQKKTKAKIIILEAAPRLGGRIETYQKQGLSYEAGAGRFNNKHKMLHELLIELDLLKHKVAIPTSSDVIISPQSKIFDDYSTEFPSFNSIIKRIYSEVKKRKLSNAALTSTNLLDLATLVLPEFPMISKYMVDAYAYYSELKWLNAKSSLDIFINEFNEDIQYYILAGGLSQIIESLSSSLKKHGCDIYTATSCTDITYDDSTNQYTVYTNNKHVAELHTDTLVLACNKVALEQFSLLKPIKPLLNTVSTQPLYRIYARYPKNADGSYWFSNIIKTVTNLKIKFIIPYDLKHGLIMISYTDSKYSNYWLNLRLKSDEAFMTELNRELGKLYPDANIPAPLWMTHHYWANGAAYWRVGYDADIIIPKIIKPFSGKSLYICGENYSNHQAWIEGALETANLVLDKLEADEHKELNKTKSHLQASKNSKVDKTDKTGGAIKFYTSTEVAKHSKKSDAWIIIHNKVYNITKWIPKHPGGNIIMTGVGKDATSMFESIGHSSQAHSILKDYFIGHVKKS